VQFGTPWFRSHTRLADGRLLFGGSQGMLVVWPERFEPSSDQPSLVLSALRVNGLPHQPESLRQGLVLPPGTRSFGVEFAALEFADPQLVRYRHRLVGYDPDWVPSDASFRSPSYSQLTPGRYTLEVQATNRSGLWSPHVLRLPVWVQPAWWQRWWAPWLLAGSVGVALWAWIQWRLRQHRRRESRLQALVDERTAELRNASLTDPLTGLRNRRYVAQRMAGDLALALRQHQQRPGRDDADLIVYLIDLDHFKRINDEHGHAAGDAVLVQAAQRLREVFRDTDTLARWGGEEFLVVARASDRRHAAELADRLRYRLGSEPYTLGDGLPRLNVTASIGFVAHPPDPARPEGWDWASVLQLADAALYAAKDAGRDAWVGVAHCPVDVAGVGSPADWLQDPRALTQRSAPR
jgi:diguanylate cyclase (GGDEF)-like protein